MDWKALALCKSAAPQVAILSSGGLADPLNEINSALTYQMILDLIKDALCSSIIISEKMHLVP